MDNTELVSRGQRAKELMSDPLISEALQLIPDAIRDQWDETNDSSQREELWYTLQGFKRFAMYFNIVLENGMMAKRELEKEMTDARSTN
jgi:hypothetical protein